MRRDDPRVPEAQAIPLAEVVARLDVPGLHRTGHELVGPCPVCGGSDRFGVNTRKGVWQCRRCGGKGDGIALVRFVLGCDFVAALDWLVGAADVQIDPAEAARRAKERAKARAAAEARADKERRDAIAYALSIWKQGEPAEGTAVRAYLERRGFTRDMLPVVPPTLRYHPDLPYMIRDKDRGGWRRVHSGPAMLAAVQAPDGRVTAVHRTWLDLGQTKGKARITADGRDWNAKKTLGSKKGGAIRLSTAAPVMVMGEGIETTLTAMVTGTCAPAAYWAGVDLGNMAGRARPVPGKRRGDLPDMSDAEAFVPPPGTTRLVYVMDGDSDPASTRAQLLTGLRRAMIARPGLTGHILPVPVGRDLNDLLMGAA